MDPFPNTPEELEFYETTPWDRNTQGPWDYVTPGDLWIYSPRGTSGKWAPYMETSLGADENYVTDAEKTKLSNLSGTNSGDQTATTVPFTPAGTVAATNVQAAIEELAGDIAGAGGSTNLAATLSATNIIVTSDTGTDATLPAADGTNAGLMVPAQFTKLENTSGTNTGDETAARIATALNAGTQDTTAADTDKLAVTHPAGGWMLLSTLWMWIKAKIDAGMTIAGAQTFSGQVQLAAGQAATDAQSAMSLGLVDARYGTPYNLRLTTDWSAASFTNRTSTENVVLPIGTYEFEGCVYADTISVTAGINVGFTPSNLSADITRGILTAGGSSSLNGGVDTSADITPRVGSNVFQYICGTSRDGGASGLACFATFRGVVTFSVEQTIRMQIAHRTITAATATVNGTRYTILSLGTTVFTSFGATSQTVGLVFTATGACTGTGAVTAPTIGSSIAVTSAVAGRSYVIDSVGDTSFTAIGAASNTANLTFTATGAGTGTGMISQITSAAVAKAGSFINFTKR